jgi:hypothetical protein
MKKNGEGGKFNCDIFDIRTFIIATMCPHPAQLIKKKKRCARHSGNSSLRVTHACNSCYLGRVPRQKS